MAENEISAGFNDSQFEIRFNQESWAFFNVIIEFLILKDMGIHNKISILLKFKI